MSNSMTLFSKLCSALQTCSELPDVHPDRQRGLLLFAQELVEDIVKSDNVKSGLNSAMHSNHVALIDAFPVSAPNQYSTTYNKGNIEIWAQNVNPDVVVALSKRGLDLKDAEPHLLTRAFRQKDQRLRDWALAHIATQPRNFSWLHTLTPHNLSRNPLFGAQLLQSACDTHPMGAEDLLSRCYNRVDSLRACLLLHGLPKTAAWTQEPKVARISSHQKMNFWRGDLIKFCQDKDAIRAARSVFG